MSDITGRCRADFPAWDCAQMFAIASDIESYPLFLPWCRSARILSREGDLWQVENHFGAGPVDQVFLTQARLEQPHRLTITSDQPPFSRFVMEWHFQDRPQGGCLVTAQYGMRLASPLLHGLARFSMAGAENKILARFRDRARQLYGA